MHVFYSAGTTVAPPRSPIMPRSPGVRVPRLGLDLPPSINTSPSPSGSPRSAKGNISPRSPSPRCATPRGLLGWRPVMPGYKPERTGHGAGSSVVIQRTVEVKHIPDTDSNLKDCIPSMSKPLAVTCLVFNIISPGLGTFIAGVSVFCCSHVRPHGGDKWNVVWVNTWVALLQFLTTFLFLLGWIWSVMWGATFITISREGKEKSEEESNTVNDVGLSTVSHRVNGSSSTMRTTTTTTVEVTDGSQDRAMTPRSQAPIIVLQEAPVIIQPEPPEASRSQRILNPNNRRHQHIMRRQNTDTNDEMILSTEALEALVIHNLPIEGVTNNGAEDSGPPLGKLSVSNGHGTL